MENNKSLWNQKMSVGISQFDDHHKTLLSLIIETNRSLSDSNSRNMIKHILQSLVSYSKYHFSAEERMMGKYNYDKLEDHKKEHVIFIEKTEELIYKYSNEKQNIGNDILDFLKNWLIKHILGSDKEYGDFFKSIGYRE